MSMSLPERYTPEQILEAEFGEFCEDRLRNPQYEAAELVGNIACAYWQFFNAKEDAYYYASHDTKLRESSVEGPSVDLLIGGQNLFDESDPYMPWRVDSESYLRSDRLTHLEIGNRALRAMKGFVVVKNTEEELRNLISAELSKKR